MGEQDLQQSLQDVQSEMPEATESDDEQRRTLIERVRLELSEALDPDHDNDYDSLRERLEEALIHFADDHPRVSAAMRRAIDVLSIGGV